MQHQRACGFLRHLLLRPLPCLAFLFAGAVCQYAAWAPDALAGTASQGKRTVQTVSLSPQTLPWRIVPAHSILLKELRSGRVLYEHESEKRLSPASLTKIMSALVILERGNLADQATISKNAARAHKTQLRLKAGEVFRLEDLLKAMLIVSANDACLAAVEHVGGDEDQFVMLMNAKAAALGLADTHFSNACGFDNPDHYSTAEDLAKLSEVALQHPVFRDLVREEREIITPITGHRA
jgi:serine-type D-Ala-D-Ala carboxypeptidase (penicillin-binding protein 5/6)